MGNWQQLAQSWSQMRGFARREWDRLTNTDWDEVAGQRYQLAGRIRLRYGITKDEAEEQIENFLELIGEPIQEIQRGGRRDV